MSRLPPLRRRWNGAWLLASTLFLLAGGLQFVLIDAPRRPLLWNEPAWSGVLLVLLFFTADRIVVNIPFLGQSYSATLSDIPLAFGLVLLPSPVLLLARILGSTPTLARIGRYSRLKLTFNIALFTFHVSLSQSLFWLIAGRASEVSARVGAAVVLTLLVANVLEACFIAAAISLSDGRLDLGTLRRLVEVQLISAPTNAGLAVVAMVLVAERPWALLPLAGVLAVVLVLHRAYANLGSNYAQLQVLQTFTRSIGSTVETKAVVAEVLEQARTLLRARSAELLLLDSNGDPALWACSRRGEELDLRSHPVVQADVWWAPALRGTSVLVSAHDVSGAGEARDGLAAPMLASGGRTGVLAVSGRLDEVTTFDADQLELFETLVSHAAVSLQNGRLVDQLRDEVATREHQASHDALTELPNRRHFVQELERALADDERGSTGVLFMDLDGFKEVNDTLGHQTGDELLRLVGSRLVKAIGPSGLVARLGGDEFAVLLPRVDDVEAALTVAHLLVAALTRPVQLEGFLLDIGGSVGVALSPEHGDSASLLMRRADIAMYTAKTRGTRAEAYDSDGDTHSARRLKLISDLRRALDSNELDVVFQPKVDLLTGEVLGAEALARWQHPTLGPVPPDEFIPLAERSGLIRQLTLHVLGIALAATNTWSTNPARLSIAVNLSMRNLLDSSLPDEVALLLDQHGVAPDCLTLEVTESYLMSDERRSMAVLRRLDELGVRLSVDDFGTGYSSLSQLSRLPVKEVKIDKGFVLKMGVERASAAIVRTTISLGHELGLQVVAEGCEDKATYEKLQSHGADVVQGWYVARPMPHDVFARWLARWSPPPQRRPPLTERLPTREARLPKQEPAYKQEECGRRQAS